jgi:hypothetical protein
MDVRMNTKKVRVQKRLDYVRNCFFPKSKKDGQKERKTTLMLPSA